jgi:hypothetical protein
VKQHVWIQPVAVILHVNYFGAQQQLKSVKVPLKLDRGDIYFWFPVTALFLPLPSCYMKMVV